MKAWMKRNAKYLVAAVGAVATWGVAVLLSEPAAITSAEWAGLISAEAIALGVWATPNTGA